MNRPIRPALREPIYDALARVGGIDLDEIRYPLRSYKCIGHFFARTLKDKEREIEDIGPNALVSSVAQPSMPFVWLPAHACRVMRHKSHRSLGRSSAYLRRVHAKRSFNGCSAGVFVLLWACGEQAHAVVKCKVGAGGIQGTVRGMNTKTLLGIITRVT